MKQDKSNSEKLMLSFVHRTSNRLIFIILLAIDVNKTLLSIPLHLSVMSQSSTCYLPDKFCNNLPEFSSTKFSSDNCVFVCYIKIDRVPSFGSKSCQNSLVYQLFFVLLLKKKKKKEFDTSSVESSFDNSIFWRFHKDWSYTPLSNFPANSCSISRISMCSK